MTSVVYYSHDEAGAPTLNNAAGSLIDLLDACLVNGFNSKSVTSLVVVGGVATATISAHGYQTGRIIEFNNSIVTGGTPGALNGRKRVTANGANTVTFPAPGVPDQTATGTITAKRPSLGWNKLFSATGKAIYQRTDPQATAMLLRVEDTNTGISSPNFARALMLESATGVDAFGNRAPTAAQNSDGVFFAKGENNSTPKPWILVGDSRTFYLWTEQANWGFASYGGLCMQWFGDIASYRAADAYGCVLAGGRSTSMDTVVPRTYSPGDWSGAADSFNLARSADTLTMSPGASFIAGSSGLMGGHGPLFPSPIDNGMMVNPRVLVAEQNPTFAHPIRGIARGLVAPLANLNGRLHKRTLTNLVDFDREILMVGVMQQTQVGCVAVDITGPWS